MQIAIVMCDAAQLPAVLAALASRSVALLAQAPAVVATEPAAAAAPVRAKRKGRPLGAQPTRKSLRAALARMDAYKVPSAKIIEVLQRLGVEKFSALRPDKYADAIAALNALIVEPAINGEIRDTLTVAQA